MNRPFSSVDSADPYAPHEAGKRGAIENLLWGAIALGALLRFVWLGKQELWYDEVLSVLIASGQKSAYKLPQNVPFRVQDISQLLTPANGSLIESVKGVIRGTLGDPHPPLFYVAEHGWMRLFGNGEAALRALVMLLSLLSLWLAYGVGRRVLGDRGGLIFTALLALNPFFLSHSLNLRMYAPMLLWVLVSGGCLLALVDEGDAIAQRVRTLSRLSEPTQPMRGRRWLWRAGVALGITAGLMTQYLFAYWLFALVALALYLDRKHWFSHALTIGAGLVMFVPWAVWGVRQQVNNRQDVLNQISSVGGPLSAVLQHGKDLAQTVANQLLLGHLTTSMLPVAEPIKPTAVAIGCAVLGLVGWCVASLYRRRQYRALMIAGLMGLLPLAVALAVDVAANKYTLGFGWGRSVMVALPGCLLLVAAWLELAAGWWRSLLTALLLAVYLAVNVGDFVGRDRQVFHEVNAQLADARGPALVVMNSRAWGHVLRLAYYLNDAKDTEILASDPAEVTEALAAALAKKNYDQVLWLRSEYPLWGLPKSQVEAEAFTAETEALLKSQDPQRRLQEIHNLQGTMNLDRFVLQVWSSRICCAS